MNWTQVDDRRLRIGHLDKVMYPTGFTKAEVIEYYMHISEVMLPHLHDRPITFKRYPNGVTGGHFFEKKCPSHKPDWVDTAAAQYVEGGKTTQHCLINDRPTLIWAVNLGSLELHPSLARAQDVQCPTMVAFDLDPGPPADLLNCCEIALQLRKLFEDLGLTTFVKTSGGKGLHLYVPLNTPVTYERTKPFARAVAELLAEQMPERVTAVMAKRERGGKVFIDWSQNSAHKTTVCVYSMRARQNPTVSTPVTWREVEQARRSGKPGRLTFETADVLKRIDKHGDLFAKVLTLKQELPAFGQ